MTIPRRVLAILVALVLAVVAVPSGVVAAPHSPGIRVSSLRLRHRATPKHVAAYTYDALSLLSSQSARASYARGLPPGPGAVPWGASVAVVGCCVAAKTAGFTAGTPVLLADGSGKPVEQVTVGDKVTAHDPHTGQSETRDVVRTFVYHDVATYDVTLVTGEMVTTTEEHPFWVGGQGWTPATQLRTGDRPRAARRYLC